MPLSSGCSNKILAPLGTPLELTDDPEPPDDELPVELDALGGVPETLGLTAAALVGALVAAELPPPAPPQPDPRAAVRAQKATPHPKIPQLSFITHHPPPQ